MKNKNKVLVLVFFACLFHNTAGAEIIDRVVAVVNDEIITLSELNKDFAPFAAKIKDYGYPPEKEKELLFKAREKFIDQLVDKKLSEQQEKKLGIKVDDREVERAVEKIKGNNFFTDEDLRANLAREGITLAKYKKEIKGEILRAKLVDLEIKSKIIITDEDIKSYFEKHKDEYLGQDKYRLKNILIKIEDSSSKDEKEAAMARMKEAVGRLEKGESFDQTAMKYSEAPNAGEGGNLGLFAMKELAPEIQDALKGVSAGGYSGILDTDQGYQVFFIAEIIKTPGKSLKQASPEIERKLYKKMLNEKFKTWVGQLRKNSHIQIIK